MGYYRYSTGEDYQLIGYSCSMEALLPVLCRF